MGLDGWLISVLAHINKFKHKLRHLHVSINELTQWHSFPEQESREELLVFLPTLILLMITVGQPASDPCPAIEQIKTTLITRMFIGYINLK